MPYITIGFILLFGLSSGSVFAINYQSLSPQSTVLQKNKKTWKIETKNRTHIQLFLSNQDSFEAAEGVNFNRGDIFLPGQGRLSLAHIERKMNQLGERTYGRWRLIKYQEYGWVYQINVANTDRPIFHLVNAYSGQMIGTITKITPLQVEGQVAKD